MLDMIAKMYAITKNTLSREYGEQFSGMPEEMQAAIVAKVMSDLVQAESGIASALARKYIEEIA